MTQSSDRLETLRQLGATVRLDREDEWVIRVGGLKPTGEKHENSDQDRPPATA